MNLFKQANIQEATSMDFYVKNIVVQNTKLRGKEKKMLHKLARTRLKKQAKKEMLQEERNI